MNYCLTLLFFFVFFQGKEFEAQVVGVQDGGTIEIMLEGKRTPVRIFGIDSPEV